MIFLKRDLDDNGTKFFFGRVNTQDVNQTAIVFISLDALALITESVQIHSDGTFESVPTIFDQLYTLHLIFL